MTDNTPSSKTTGSNSKPMRQIPSLQDPKERVTNFLEVSQGLSEDQAVKESLRCLQCKNKFCTSGCPVGIDIPSFIAKIRESDFDSALDIIQKYSLFPAICGRVCPQEKQCEANCILAKKGSAIAIGLLERFVADRRLNSKLTQKQESVSSSEPEPESDTKVSSNRFSINSDKKYKVAIVGSGPSSLCVAAELSKDPDCDVHIFEAFHRAGGVLVYGIPEFRLPKYIVESEINSLTKKGVKIHLNTVIGKSVSLDELSSLFDAIYIGVGAGLPLFLNIPGEELGRIFSASDYLTRNNLMYAYKFPQYDTPIPTAKRVCVIGGGNVAMDAARTALRLKAEHVTLIYRRSMKELPARAEEVEHAISEGVEFKILTAPCAFESDEEGLYVKKIKCIKMELSQPDASGRARPCPVPGSEFYIDTDCVIVAIGSSSNPILTKSSNLKLNNKGYIEVDENGRTSNPKIWAGGDIVTGAATVIAAMGAGKKAASGMLEFLRSN